MTKKLMNRTTSTLRALWSSVWTTGRTHPTHRRTQTVGLRAPTLGTVTLRGPVEMAPARSLATLATLGRDHRVTK